MRFTSLLLMRRFKSDGRSGPQSSGIWSLYLQSGLIRCRRTPQSTCRLRARSQQSSTVLTSVWAVAQTIFGPCGIPISLSRFYPGPEFVAVHVHVQAQAAVQLHIPLGAAVTPAGSCAGLLLLTQGQDMSCTLVESSLNYIVVCP